MLKFQAGGGEGVQVDLQMCIRDRGMITKRAEITPGFMTISLESSDQQLEEVMVVAYGTAKKSSFTGAAVSYTHLDVYKRQGQHAQRV